MTLINPTRRGFLGMLLAAPVIVKATSLMAVKPVVVRDYSWGTAIGSGRGLSQEAVNEVLRLIYQNTHARRLAIVDSPQLLVLPPGLQMQARRIIGS